MNPAVFFENFELLANAPNGIQKLRELILQLAVMGKLVEQDPNDEPASILNERIKAKKKSLKKETKDKSQISQIVMNKDLSLPSNWISVRLGDLIYSILGGGTPSKIRPEYWEGGISWASVKDLGKGKYLEYTIDKITEAGLNQSSSNLIPIGRVIVCTRMGLGKIAINRIDVAINQDLKALHLFEEINLDYFYNFYLTLNITGSGMTVKGIRQEDLLDISVPLPPLAEQKRIVAKVDELMALCDKLEAHRQKKQELQSKLNSSALDRMLSAENQEEFEHYWQYICENFDLLYDNPENVVKLRQAILQLAVQGKLVEQNREDEPASVLIEKIWAEKQNKKNQPKLTKATDPLDSELKLPIAWRISKIEELSLLVTDGEHNTPTRIEQTEVPLVTAKNVRDGYLDLENTDFISNDTAEKCWKRCNPSHNDILMVCVGATTGRLCLIKNPIRFVLVRSVSLIRVDEKYIYPEYIALAMKSPAFQSQIWQNVKQSAQPCLYLNKIQNLLIPLPPLAEQKRIVEKVEQLMGLCDKLEEKLRKEREESQKFVEAVFKGVLESSSAKSESDRRTPIQEAVIPLK